VFPSSFHCIFSRRAVLTSFTAGSWRTERATPALTSWLGSVNRLPSRGRWSSTTLHSKRVFWRSVRMPFRRFSLGSTVWNQRFVDLLQPFRAFRYYHPAQHGSASMKAVLPALTGRGYEDLAIRDGDTASREFLRVTFGNSEPEERDRVYRRLAQYCGLDTQGNHRPERLCLAAGLLTQFVSGNGQTYRFSHTKISGSKGWGGQRDLNPRQPDPQSGALTRLSYGHQSGKQARFLRRASQVPRRVTGDG
jgi:hypothetical protein